MRHIFTTLFALFLLLSSPLTYAQSVPPCTSIASDTDGDGWGWENDASCRVVEQTATAPQFINLETGQPVSLTRAMWNAEDFNKNVACREFDFDGTEYLITSVQRLLLFDNLPLVAPFVGNVEILHPGLLGDLNRTTVVWGLDNGIYNGPTGLGLSPWVEVFDVFYPSGDVSASVRIWVNEHRYTECISVDPRDSFTPSGVLEIPTNTGACIDSDGDGWGWDGVASCRI